jgi:hypothetical protein
MKHLLPHVVDAIFAAVSVVSGIALLYFLENMLSINLFDPKMLASTVIFCGNPAPPSPHSFIVCTACAFVAGILLRLSMAGTTFAGEAAIAAGCNVLLSKLVSVNFPPAVGLATVVATKPWQHSLVDPLTHLVTPWLAGHCIIYVFAIAMSYPRKYVRVQLAMREWRSQAGKHMGQSKGEYTTAKMKELFTRCDTTGDGRIDATEFKIAYRILTGSADDLPLSDCEEIVRAFDSDGTNTIEFSEFLLAVEPYCMNSKLKE